MPNHISIKPIKCQVAEKYFYNLDESKTGWLKAKIIGLISYPGSSLALHVVIEETGAIFTYLPLDSVRPKETDLMQFDYHALDYEFCHHPNMVGFSLEHLRLSKLVVFIKSNDELFGLCADYICTLDWPDDNFLQHFVKLENGQFAAVPNHKILVNASGPLPEYKKLRHRWT